MKTAPSRLLLALLTCLAVVGGGVLAAPGAQAASTGNNARHTGKIVGTKPTSSTPGVMDGTVETFAQVGNLIIVGGSFTLVRDPGSTVDIPRRNLFAFDATTGKVSTTFAPNPDSGVMKILPATDGTSVYVGGGFNNITSGGVATAASRLVRLSVSTGAKITSFNPGTINGQVRDLELTGNRLYVAGKFTHLQGKAQKGMGTLNATTGAYDPYFTAVFAGTHRPELSTISSVLEITINPANNRLVATGNFTSVNGQTRSQIAMFDLSGTTSYALANWYTTLFQSACGSQFDTYITDVSYSPDGSYFAVSTTGGFGGDYASSRTESGCDVVARFESNTSGLTVRPTWGTYTGGDTTWAIEVTDDVIYAGGHQRWQNNPLGAGTSTQGSGQGAVERTGIAALNPVNGMPYQWNPTRTRGVGVKDMLATDAGLYVGSDTTVFNGSTRNRIAFAPLSSGKTLPVEKALTLPGDVFTVAAGGSQLIRRQFDGTVAGAPTNAANGPGWSTTVGAFMLNGTLYTAKSDGKLYKQSFDGTTYGTIAEVNTADLIVPQATWHGEVPAITSLFYSDGRIYYTRSGQTSLYSRAFEPESDVVGQVLTSSAAVTGVSFSGMRGAFVAGGKLYYGTTTGTLSVADWNGTGPVASTSRTVTGAGSGWTTRAMFVYQGDALPPATTPTNTAPVAKAAAVTCTDLVCSFDGSGSTDSDGTISSYAWNFGDGTTGTGATVKHTYATAGAKTVTLTVTDNGGAKDTTTITANPTEPPANPPANVAPVGKADVSCADLVCSFSGSGSTDSDGTISSYAWDFGDGTTGTGATAQRTYATAGAKTVTLTVTDNGGAKDTTTITANPTEAGTPASPVSFVAANTSQGNRTNHTVAIPATVQPGDQLVLFLTGNTLTPTYSAPEGWTLLQTRSGGNSIGFAYGRTAVAGDAGSNVTIVTSGYAKDVMTVAAYRGGSVTASTSTLETTSSIKHTTPAVTAPDSSQWLVSYWSDKSSTTTAWTLPAGVTRRAAPLGTGTGHTSAVLGDSDGTVAAGARGSLVATADVAAQPAIMFSLLIG